MTKKQFEDLKIRIENLENLKPILDRYIKELIDARRRLQRVPGQYCGTDRTTEYDILELLAQEAVNKFYNNK